MLKANSKWWDWPLKKRSLSSRTVFTFEWSWGSFVLLNAQTKVQILLYVYHVYKPESIWRHKTCTMKAHVNVAHCKIICNTFITPSDEHDEHCCQSEPSCYFRQLKNKWQAKQGPYTCCKWKVLQGVGVRSIVLW